MVGVAKRQTTKTEAVGQAEDGSMFHGLTT